MTTSDMNLGATASPSTPADEPSTDIDPLEVTRPLPPYRPERLGW